MIRCRRLAVVLVASCALLAGSPGAAWATARVDDPTPAARVWTVAREQLLRLTGPTTTLPFGSTAGGRYRRTNAYAWTAGFFPASLWLLYAHGKDPAVLAAARRYTDLVLPVARWRGTHDLGFIIGMPATLGAQFDPDADRQARYTVALSTAATTLTARWNARVGALKSADYAGRWGVIIDSAMNAPMLIREGQRIGKRRGGRLADIGTRHLLTLASHFVRPDGSTFHRLAFNPRSGALVGPLPGQGLSVSSTWARGQAWAIDGFAQGYALTRDPRLLLAARRTADFWISRVPSDTVPPWDLDVTKPNAPRDSSAAAIASDGLLTLALVEEDPARAVTYRTYAQTLLATLENPPWVSSSNGTRGVLQRQAYSVAIDPREGTYVWGDAFLLKALSLSG